ncbi:hypothetical protein EYR40_003031 [Pleurotus pulmonarius]|nr:hypothetical protein EYR40_003031 [Pleurotus pulmonarius]
MHENYTKGATLTIPSVSPALASSTALASHTAPPSSGTPSPTSSETSAAQTSIKAVSQNANGATPHKVNGVVGVVAFALVLLLL